MIIDLQRDRASRGVGVQRSHRSVVTGVHRLQEVERFGSAHFADDDPLGTHAQAVSDQFTHRDLSLSFEVRRTGFQPHHMRLLEVKFGGVFAGDDALVGVDVAVRQFSSVVLPEPVPPEISTLLGKRR